MEQPESNKREYELLILLFILFSVFKVIFWTKLYFKIVDSFYFDDVIKNPFMSISFFEWEMKLQSTALESTVDWRSRSSPLIAIKS